MKYVDPVHLRQVLTQYYSEAELRTMCFELGIDYDSLGGRGKSEKALELVAFSQRNGRLDDIAAYVRNTRPRTSLKMTDALPSLPEAVSGSVGPVIHVTGDMIGGEKVDGYVVGDDKITVGDISGSSNITIGQGASITATTVDTNNASSDVKIDGRDINIDNKAEFDETAKVLKQLLEKAVTDGEFEDSRDGEDALKELNDIIDEAKSGNPRPRSIKRSLGNLTEILSDATKIAEATGKEDTTILRANPVVFDLTKIAQRVFYR